MQKELKQTLAKILGEIYKVQTACNIECDANAAKIYGLVNGIESAIDEEFSFDCWTSNSEMETIMRIFSEIDQSREKSAAFKGYDHISAQVKAAGLHKGTVIMAARYYNLLGMFRPMTDKILYEISPEYIDKLMRGEV